MAYLVCNGADVEDVNSRPLRESVHFLEMLQNEPDPVHQCPRVFVTHLAEKILAGAIRRGRPKVIITMRNPKDTLVSFFHWHRNMPFLAYPGAWNDFFELYRQKELYYGDYFQYNVSWWEYRNDENFLFLRYEDMRRDRRSAVERIAQHCHVTMTSEQVDRIVANTGFATMRSSHAIKSSFDIFGVPINKVLRKGAVGEWREVFSTEQSDYVDAQCENLLHPLGLKFDLE